VISEKNLTEIETMQTNRIQNKQVIYECMKSLRHVRENTVDEYMEKYWHADAKYHGFFPIDTLEGRQAIAEGYYKPYKKSFPDASKHMHFLFAGEFDGKEFVVTGGNLVGNFMQPFLDIPATKLCTWVRFAEFFEMKDGKIIESKMIYDLMSLLGQAGYKFLPAIGPEIVIPGPANNDGVVLGNDDPELSKQSLAIVEDMIFNGLAGDLHKMEKGIIPNEQTLESMRKFWHEDMIWYGPDCIGTGKGIYGFEFVHELPWEMTMSNINGSNHFARFSENNLVASGGYPSIYCTHSGAEIFGIPASNKNLEVRDFNFWCIEDGLIKEDWCILDIAHMLYQLGYDVLKKVREDRHYFRTNRGSVL
jgi:predicted ester cyclase